VLFGVEFLDQERAVGWYYSLPRLAANVALWLLLLGVLAGTCEWLLRRYRPRPRWSLRGLLVFVAMAGVLFAWYANARNRAAIQDPLVPLQGGYGTPLVFVDRWGPKWLDLLGMDPLRRRIVLANSWSLNSQEPASEQAFLQLARAPELRHLIDFHVDELTPTTAKALGGMPLQTLDIELKRLTSDVPFALSELRQLRSLSIGQGWSSEANDDDARLADECLTAIGNMTRLESLSLSNLPLHAKGLACLAGLKSLKSLDIDFWDDEWTGSDLEKPIPEDWLWAIATLTQLEWLKLTGLRVNSASLASMEGLTELKTLGFERLATKDRPMLSHLPPLQRLEALELSRSEIADDDLGRLAVLPRLQLLCLGSSSSGEEPFFSAAGLARLASVKSLVEVELSYDINRPADIEALGVIQGLKKVHLQDGISVGGDSSILTLDDGKEWTLRDSDGFRRAIEALRQSKPGIVINGGGISFPARPRLGGMADLTAESVPHRPSPWLPGGDVKWMTPQEFADFEKSGGRVSFDRVTLPDREDNHLITVEY
jgi:hypothetical protein